MGKNKRRFAGQAKKPNILSGQAAAAPEKGPSEFCVSLKHFDSSQGQSFEHWEQAGFLSKLLERWRAQSSKPMLQCFDRKFHRYGAFPLKSGFRHPRHVPPDAVWASMHIQSKECVGGHVIGNVFYVVFLDCDHKFWPVEKKNT
jgi:hypothetical protein